MEELKKNNNIMDGKGEGKETKWITVKGTHIPLKDGESPKEAIKRHFNNIDKKNTKIKLGKINTNIYNQILGKELVNSNLVISIDNIKHVSKRHLEDYEKFKDDIKEIINNPDYVFSNTNGKTDKERRKRTNRVLVVKKLDGQALVVLELSFDNKKFSNKAISFWEVSEDYLNKLRKNEKTLYKK